MQTQTIETRWPARRIANLLLGAMALLVAAVLSTPALTQTPAPIVATSPPPLAGRWELAIPEAQAQARIEQGIAGAVDGMPPIVDSIASGQLRSRTPISRAIEITATPTRIVVRFDLATYDTAPGRPQACPMVGQSGETVDVVQSFTDDRLQQAFTTPRGRRWNTFVTSDDGSTMTLDVIVQSDQLPAPMRFSLPYRRTPSR